MWQWFMTSCFGCQAALVILPRLSDLADEVVRFLGWSQLDLKKKKHNVFARADTVYMQG